MATATEEDKKSLDYSMHVRVEKSEFDIFIAKAERVTGKPYTELVREIITAFNDDKLRIIPTKDYQAGVLYSKF